MCARLYVHHACRGLGGHKRASGPLEPGLLAIVRAASALSHAAISVANFPNSGFASSAQKFTLRAFVFVGVSLAQAVVFVGVSLVQAVD